MDSSILKVALAVFVASIPVLTFLWKVATSLRKVTTKDDIKSLKDEAERKLQSLKSDTERDRDSLQNDLMEVRQNFFNHVSGHPIPSPAKTETRHEGPGPPSLEVINTREKGDFTADEHENRTRS